MGKNKRIFGFLIKYYKKVVKELSNICISQHTKTQKHKNIFYI